VRSHTLSVLVQNQPGVLARISGLFRPSRLQHRVSGSRGPPRTASSAALTLVIEVESDAVLEQITKQLNKLVEVIRILEFDPGEAVRRELILVKVRSDGRNRSQVLEIAEMFRGRVVDRGARLGGGRGNRRLRQDPGTADAASPTGIR